jgi:peptidyl-dipeptidase A
MRIKFVFTLIFTLFLNACSLDKESAAVEEIQTAVSAAEFVQRVQAEMQLVARESEIAAWVRNTYITPDTGLISAKANERWLAFLSEVVEQSKQYNDVEMSVETRRALDLLKLSTSLPAPSDQALRAELSTISTELEGMYGAGEFCDANQDCRDLGALEDVIDNSRDYDALLEAWEGWRTVAEPMRPMYTRMVEIANAGAVEMGYADLGVMWKSGYDMDVPGFELELERLWSQVEPMYEELQCYVHDRLQDTYGADKVVDGEPIPAHLLGNMWAQQWSNIYDLVEPYPGVLAMDVTANIESMGWSAVEMTEVAEEFFTSLGLPELPESFWTNSMLTKPADRDVVCHASAWDMDNGNDVRIKQCVEPTEDEFSTLHHELGHIYYYLMYKDQPLLFKGGAHDGFHEAVGDTLTLSMTPGYLRDKGLIESVEVSEEATINQLMKMALDKIAFLPFGKLIDEWRWRVFSGEVSEQDYNDLWWSLRTEYQGIAPPVERPESAFDPGAKFHIPGNTPYTRYFLSFIMQFQFYKSLCETAGHEGALHECSIYGNTDAGNQLGDMLALGASKPWPDAMQALTGQRQMDAYALVEYFSPLTAWLQEQNEGKACGW